jgi:hypothetical protein
VVKAKIPSFPPHLIGNASAVSALLERIIPGSSAQFELVIVPLPLRNETEAVRETDVANHFTISDTKGGKTRIEGTTASELTGGLGVYLREHCGMTFGWVRGGGNHVFTPKTWPKVGKPITIARSVP